MNIDKVSQMSGFYVYDEIGKEIKISEKTKSIKKNFSASTIVLSFLLFVSVLFSISFRNEKENAIEMLNKTLETIEQESHSQTNEAHFVKEQEMHENIETFKVYVVQIGDYLESICEENDLDYIENVQKIMTINGITDANKIYVGQKLYLPINE